MNKNKLKSIISKKANGNTSVANQLYQMFFFEHILDRLSKSKYKHNIILKGGLLLSSIIGDDERTTKDMDATLKSLPLEKDNVTEIINEILNIDIEDDIKFEIESVNDIRLEDEYGGFRIGIIAKMSTIKHHLFIELTTGDKITPREIEYNYNCIFEDKKIPILAYTIETIIAEKYHSITTRGIFNTRMKDYYDIYVLVSDNKDKIDFTNLVKAIQNTYKHRDTELNINEIKEQLDSIRTSQNLMKLWENYKVTAPYAEKINYDDLLKSLDYITNILSESEVSV